MLIQRDDVELAAERSNTGALYLFRKSAAAEKLERRHRLTYISACITHHAETNDCREESAKQLAAETTKW